MNAAATPARSSTPFDLARFSEELAQVYDPQDAHERMLVSQIAQSRERLERAYELERAYCRGRDLSEIVRTKVEEFKIVMRYLTDSERAWRHAVLALEKAQRRRKRETVKAAPPARTPSVSRPVAQSRPPESAVRNESAVVSPPAVIAMPRPQRE
jgi:hypothetical protein